MWVPGDSRQGTRIGVENPPVSDCHGESAARLHPVSVLKGVEACIGTVAMAERSGTLRKGGERLWPENDVGDVGGFEKMGEAAGKRR